MNKFEFSKSILKLDIAGNIFEVDTGRKDLAEKMAEVQNKSLEFEKQINENVTEETITNICEFMADSINNLLGKNATDKIFEGRTVNILDLIDVAGYISSEIANFQIKRIKTTAKVK